MYIKYIPKDFFKSFLFLTRLNYMPYFLRTTFKKCEKNKNKNMKINFTINSKLL